MLGLNIGMCTKGLKQSGNIGEEQGESRGSELTFDIR